MEPNVTTVNHVHSSLDPVESVKIEKNTKGFNFEVKAPSVERALELVDKLTAELKTRGPEA